MEYKLLLIASDARNQMFYMNMNIKEIIEKYLSREHVLSDNDVLKLVNFLEQNFDNENVPELINEILRRSKNVYLINSISMLMEEKGLTIFRKTLLEKYFSTSYGYRGTLLFAISSFDNSCDIEKILAFFFKNDLSDEEIMVVPRLFRNMKNINNIDKTRLIDNIHSKKNHIDDYLADMISEILN